MNQDLQTAAALAIHELTFASPAFLFAFMPAFFLAYYATPRAHRNLVLLLASLSFYFANVGYGAWLLVASIGANWYFALALERARARGTAHALLAAGILVNLLPLLYYKYWTFFAGVANDVGSLAGASSWRFEVASIPLLAGISFFTFQGISYLIDVHQRLVQPAKRLVDFGMSAQVLGLQQSK